MIDDKLCYKWSSFFWNLLDEMRLCLLNLSWIYRYVNRDEREIIVLIILDLENLLVEKGCDKKVLIVKKFCYIDFFYLLLLSDNRVYM